MESTIESIQKRHSVRNYSDKVIEDEKIQQILAYFNSNKKGPFNNEVRFQLVDALAYNERELKELGTYGFMKGARLFIAGSVNRNIYAMEDFGYCMEKNILMATKLGLGTCWMGGSLNRSTFAQKMKISDNEIIPAITPIGYAESKNSVKGEILALVTRSKQRKPAREIFFNGDINNSIDLKKCGDYASILECVRIAPSAGNIQPWRVIMENNCFHFFLSEKAWYNNHSRYEGARLQNIDMGIAMAHFDLASSELGLSGKWQVSAPSLEKGNLKYIVSWMSGSF